MKCTLRKTPSFIHPSIPVVLYASMYSNDIHGRPIVLHFSQSSVQILQNHWVIHAWDLSLKDDFRMISYIAAAP